MLRPMMQVPSILALGLLSGCLGSVPLQLPERAGRAAPAAAARLDGLLSAAIGDVEPKVFHVPVERWPRSLRNAGPVYVLVHLSPYVGQLGAIAETRRADAGSGYGAVLGYRIPAAGATVLGFEILREASGHWNSNSDVAAAATRTCLALRANFRADSKVQPLAVAGGGLYAVEFEGLDPRFDISGPGFLLGGGVDFAPSRRFSARVELSLHVWAAAEESGGGGLAGTLAFNLGAALSF